ncbi:hypothetical protein AB0J97_11965, partial [Nonomuraea sp. NPDC049607]
MSGDQFTPSAPPGEPGAAGRDGHASGPRPDAPGLPIGRARRPVGRHPLVFGFTAPLGVLTAGLLV